VASDLSRSWQHLYIHGKAGFITTVRTNRLT
jgi:hypothetical protein